MTLADDIRALLDAASGGGVVSVRRDGETVLEEAWGLADRRFGVAMTTDHRLAIASGSKAFTALVVASLVHDGVLAFDMPARSLLGDDLPLVGDDVTVAHLLAHTSGIGDYIDDDADEDAYLIPVPVSRLLGPEDYLPLLGGVPQATAPGERFAYCNAGYVLLALLAERAAATPFRALVHERVLQPAGMSRTAYLRSDDLPDDAATGYLELDGVVRTNVHHLPIVGGGDGGAYTTVEDVDLLWRAFVGGRIVPADLVATMTEDRAPATEPGRAGYGYGLWLPRGGAFSLVGADAGVSFSSMHDPATGTTATVIANDGGGAWPISRALRAALAT
jgi:CubicO group peptidase (beta-lactamase class C family)